MVGCSGDFGRFRPLYRVDWPECRIVADATDCRMLKEKPPIAGLAVPGMPASAPGMAQPGAPHQPYEVLAFQRDGATELFARR